MGTPSAVGAKVDQTPRRSQTPSAPDKLPSAPGTSLRGCDRAAGRQYACDLFGGPSEDYCWLDGRGSLEASAWERTHNRAAASHERAAAFYDAAGSSRKA